MKRIHFIAGGDVQGVGLRWSAQELAGSLGLSGWIRNREDGMVEGEVQGADPKIKEFMKKLETGLGRAKISSMAQEIRSVQESELGFDIRR
jgi:acylphosphatase